MPTAKNNGHTTYQQMGELARLNVYFEAKNFG